jgi:hypothetical protein
VLVAMLVGAIAAASARNPAMRSLSWLLVVYVMAVALSNMIDTARRHPYLGSASLTWAELQALQGRVARGEVAETLAAQPFPTRRFLYAFEVAAAFESVKGAPIDFRPMDEPQQGLVRHLDMDIYPDPNIAPSAKPSEEHDADVVDPARSLTPIDARFFRAGSWVGERGVWGYRWRLDGSGDVQQQSWRYGLMRVWSAAGRVEQRGANLCLTFSTTPSTCFASLHQDGDWILAFASDGRLVTRFRWES